MLHSQSDYVTNNLVATIVPVIIHKILMWSMILID